MKLLKIIVAVTLVVGLLLGGALPVLANSEVASTQPSLLPLQPDNGKPPWAGGKVKVIRGVVEDKTDDSIILESGEEIFVEDATRYRVPTLDKSASLDDIEIGMQIVALVYQKEVEDTLYHYARHIVVVPSRPIYGHHVGKLLEYNEGDSITIEDKWGNEVIFEIGDNFKELPPGVDMEQAEAEQRWVTVITRGHPVSGSRIAVGVVVHSPRTIVGRIIRMRLQGLDYISGTITVDETSQVITVDSMELDYDADTLFVMRGVFSAQGQSAIVFYKDGLAKVVLVRVEPSEIEEGAGEP